MMNLHLPDYRSKEDGVLYIIGNGFDLYHGLETHYSDFRDWLKDKYPDFVYKMQKIYPYTDPEANPDSKDGGIMLWKSFEEALGYNADLQTLHHFFTDKCNDFNSLSIEKQQNYASEKIKETLDQISPLLKEWSESFSEKYKEVKKLLPLGKNSKYITFNYTRVLEEVYGIDGKDHVWHIHGSAYGDNVIAGYGGTLLSDTVYGSPIEEASERNILQELQTMRKPTENIYHTAPKSFTNLEGIKTIIVIGHSLADVDLPYFRYMLETLSDYANIEWQYWVHTDKAKQEAQERIKNICYENVAMEDIMSESIWKYYIMEDWKQKEIHHRKLMDNKIIILTN